MGPDPLIRFGGRHETLVPIIDVPIVNRQHLHPPTESREMLGHSERAFRSNVDVRGELVAHKQD